MHAVSRAADRLMISLRRAIPAGRRSHPAHTCCVDRGETVWLNLCEFFLLFVLQNGFDLAPPYRDYTRRVCDVQTEGKFGWRYRCWVC